jgi:hypothetical protein
VIDPKIEVYMQAARCGREVGNMRDKSLGEETCDEKTGKESKEDSKVTGRYTDSKVLYIPTPYEAGRLLRINKMRHCNYSFEQR